MKKRPVINIKLTALDTFLETISLILLITLWAYTLINFSDLPDIIPTHYDALGKVDNTGSKWSIFVLAGVASFLYAMLIILNRFPHYFNYLAEITEENAYEHYQLSTRLMRVIKLFLLLLFGAITFETIHIAKGSFSIFGIWFMPLTVLLIIVPIIIYFYKANKIN